MVYVPTTYQISPSSCHFYASSSYLCGMKKLLCPQCKIAAMYVKNEQGERLLVYVLENGEVVPKYPEDSMEGFDLTEVFCLGCSWHGSPKRLVKR